MKSESFSFEAKFQELGRPGKGEEQERTSIGERGGRRGEGDRGDGELSKTRASLRYVVPFVHYPPLNCLIETHTLAARTPSIDWLLRFLQHHLSDGNCQRPFSSHAILLCTVQNEPYANSSKNWNCWCALFCPFLNIQPQDICIEYVCWVAIYILGV